jgi:hypothetical protein
MAKISIIDRHTHLRLIVEGDLVGPWAAELKSACEKANVDLRDRELVLDIRHLTAISQEGENVLLQLMRNGTKFRGSGVFTKHVLRQLSGRAVTTFRENYDYRKQR